MCSESMLRMTLTTKGEYGSVASSWKGELTFIITAFAGKIVIDDFLRAHRVDRSTN